MITSAQAYAAAPAPIARGTLGDERNVLLIWVNVGAISSLSAADPKVAYQAAVKAANKRTKGSVSIRFGRDESFVGGPEGVALCRRRMAGLSMRKSTSHATTRYAMKMSATA